MTFCTRQGFGHQKAYVWRSSTVRPSIHSLVSFIRSGGDDKLLCVSSKKRTENHYTFLQLYVWVKWKNCFSINLVIDKLFDKFVIDILILKVGFHRHSLGKETFVLSSSLFSKSADYSAGSWLFWSLPQNVNLPVLNYSSIFEYMCLQNQHFMRDYSNISIFKAESSKTRTQRHAFLSLSLSFQNQLIIAWEM